MFYVHNLQQKNKITVLDPCQQVHLLKKSHKIIRLNTLYKESDLESRSNILMKRSSTKVKINSLKTIYPQFSNLRTRKYTEIEEQLTLPESPPKLFSPSKQYETKLNLSAQSWVIHDMKANLYKRGWKPNKISPFNGLFRILVLLCYCQIIKQNEKAKKIKVKINPEHLKESKLKFCKKNQHHLKWIALTKKTPKTLSKNSIVYFIDIVKSIIISGNLDLFEYAVIYCGYLIAQLKLSTSESFNQAIVDFNKENQEEVYANIFCQYCNEFLLPLLGLENTRTQNQQDSYWLFSTPNQICKIFLKGFIDHPFFRQTISLHQHSFYIKYQVGYNYWQERMVNIKSQKEEIRENYCCYLVYKGSKNYEAVCYNAVLDIIMIVEDCKFSMAELDIAVLQKWYNNVTKPIAAERKKSVIFSPTRPKKSLLPILTISKG